MTDGSGPLSLCYSLAAWLGTGGMGRLMLASVDSAQKEGWRVRAIASAGSGCPENTELVQVDISRLLKLALYTPARFSPAWMRWVAERSHDLKAARLVGTPDLFQGASHCCLSSLRAAKRAGAITIVDSLNAHARHLNRVMRVEEKLAGSLGHFHNRFTVARCEAEYAEADYVLCNSSYSRRTFIEEGVPEDKVITVPLPVEAPREVADHTRSGRFRVIFVGHLDLRKGFRYLLAAWEKLNLPNSELYLRGGTGDRVSRKLLESWKRRTSFTNEAAYGPVPYHEFSVLVLPSISDGFGLVVPEAMAAGLPVIASENVGAADCVREGVDGFVVPVGDVEALSARLECLARDRDKLSEMGRAARERSADFSPDKFRSSYAAAIRKATGQ